MSEVPGLLPAENMAYTVARSMAGRGENPGLNLTAALLIAVERLAPIAAAAEEFAGAWDESLTLLGDFNFRMSCGQAAAAVALLGQCGLDIAGEEVMRQHAAQAVEGDPHRGKPEQGEAT